MQNQFEDKNNNVKEPWKKIIKTVVKHRGLTIGLILSVVLLAILDVCYPLLNQYAIEQYFSENPNFNSVTIFIVGYAILAVLYGLSVFLFLFFAGRIEVATSYDLRKEAYINLQNLPFSYFDKTAQGWIMARLTSDARKLSEIISYRLRPWQSTS